MGIAARKKKKSNPMGDYIPSKEEKEAYVWGVRNGIIISPRGTPSGTEWLVDIKTNNGWKNNGKTYGPVDVWEVVYNYYKHYYDDNKRM